MPDRLRIVEIPTIGDNGRFRPVTLLDIEDQATYFKTRDTFAVTAPERTPMLSELSGRRGGSRQVGEKQGNARVAASWRVKGATQDLVLANAETLMRHADELLERPQRFIEWRPDGATYSTFFKPRGVGEVVPEYKWSDFALANAVAVQVAWPVAPLAYGLPMDVDDAFAVDSEVDYRFDAGLPANVLITGGQLTFTGALTTAYRLVHTATGYRTNDKAVWMEFVHGVAGSGGAVVRYATMVKVVDVNNYLYIEYSDDGTLRRTKLLAVIGGVLQAALQDVASAVLTNGSVNWMCGAIEGDRVVGGLKTGVSSPSRTTTSFAGGAIDFTLTGTALTTFGNTVVGEGGIIVQPQSASARVNRLLIDNFQYRNAIVGTKTLRGIPGTAPCLVDAEVSPADGLGAFHAMLAWNRPLSAQQSFSAFGPVPAELAGTPTGAGWSLVADANALSGDVRRLNMATMAASKLEFLLGDDALDPDPFTDECLVELWLVMTVPTTAVALTIAARSNPFGSVGTVGDNRWTLDWGPYGRTIPTPPTAGRMAYRLGAIPVPVFEHSPGLQGTYFYVEFFAGTSTGNLDVDYLHIVPSKRRALGPTGKLTSSITYPKFIDSLGGRKRISSDLRTLRLDDQSFGTGLKVLRHPGFEGSPLEMDATRQNAIAITHRLAHNVPDDPAPVFVQGEDWSASQAGTYQYRVTPRWRLARS